MGGLIAWRLDYRIAALLRGRERMVMVCNKIDLDVVRGFRP
jgi:hypothetical protein